MARAVCIGAKEPFALQTLCSTCCMYHIVPALSAHFLFEGCELLAQFLWIAHVQLCKTYARVGQVLLAATMPHASPHLVAASQPFADNETTDEARGSCDKYSHNVLLMSASSILAFWV